jgi:hypothetical protein
MTGGDLGVVVGEGEHCLYFFSGKELVRMQKGMQADFN